MINLTDRRVTTALAAIFALGLACVLLLGLAILTLCAMLVNALVSTIAEIFTIIGSFYSTGGPLTHLIILLGVLFAILYSFKQVRTPALRFFQRQFAHFTAFAQQRQTPPASKQEDKDRDYEEGEVIDLDAEEQKRQARTTASSPHTGNRHTTTIGKSRKQRRKQKRSRHAATARAVLALTHA